MTDIFTLGLKVDTTDIDKGSKSLDNIAKSADGADKKTQQMREGVNATGKAIAAFGVTTVAALGVVAVSASNAAREITNLSRLSNQTVEDFQRTAFAARAYGIEQDKLTDILKDTQDKVGDFLTTGAGPMVDFFEKIAPRVGITADNFRTLNGKDALQLYVSSLEKANLSQSEMVFFMEAIASDATLLQPLLANNGEEFLRLADRADQLGVVLDELDITNLNGMKTALGELSAIAEGTSNVIGATLAPFITDLTNRFNDNTVSADAMRDAITSVIETGVTVAGVFADAGRVFEIFGKTLGATAFTFVERFDTMEKRLEQLSVNFRLTFDEVQLSLTEWVNEQDEELARWATSMVNATDVFDLFDDVTIEPMPLNTAELEASIASLKEQSAGLESDLVQSNENIKNAWQDVIDTMLLPLPSEGMEKWVSNIVKAVEAQRDLQKEIKKTGEGNNKIVKTAGSDAVKWISNTKEVTKGLNVAFGENEKVAKRLHQVNQIIGIAEQAMILQKVIADNAATQVHIANSTAKATANATEAVTAAAAAPFPVGFAAAAAMIGLMASVLGGFSGGGSASYDPTEDRQASQGTGTVLGSSDKSQSIINAQERFEDISIDQLAELRGIRDSNNMIASGISQLTNTVVISGIGEFGGELGEVSKSFAGFGSTKKKVIDEGIQFISQTLGDIVEGGIVNASAFFDIETTKKKWFGLSKKKSTSTEFGDIDDTIQEQMAAIFGHIGDTVLKSAKSLGFETVSVLQSTITGGLLDDLDLDGFGRGVSARFIETFELTELSLEDALSQFRVNIGKISLEGLSGEEIEAEMAAVFSQQADLIAEYLVPGIAEYQRVGEGLFDTLLRVAHEQAIFNDAIAQMGMDLSTLSNVIQIDIAQSLIELVGGAERFSDLTSEFFSEFFSEAEQFEQLSTSLTEAVEGLGLSMFENRAQFRAMVEGLDLTTEAGQALFAALLELVPSMDEYFDTLENDAATEAAEAERELEAARRAETEAAREAAKVTRDLERAASSAFSDLSKAIRTEQNALKSGLKEDILEIRNTYSAHRDALKGQLTASMESIDGVFEGRRSAIQARTEQQIDSMEKQLDVAKGQLSALASLSNVLGSAIVQIVGIGRAQARNVIQDAIASARDGNSLAGVDLQGAVSALTNINANEFGSALELQKERSRTANELGELKDLTDGQLSVAERSVMMLESQIEAVTLSGDRQIEALNEAQKLAEEEEQRRFDESSALLDAMQAEQEAAAHARFDEELAALEATLENAREQLDALLGIDTSVKSLVEAEAAFADALLAAINAQAGTQEAVIADIVDKIKVIIPGEKLPGLVPLPVPPPQYILPVDPIVSSTKPGTFAADDVLRAIALSSAKTAKMLDRWDGDGQPAIRDVS